MRAVLQTTYGGAHALTVGYARRPPPPGPREVLVQVHAAGVDRAVWHMLNGTPYPFRLATGLCRPRHPIPGVDLSGRVIEVGREVRHLHVGDEVFGLGKGTYAEFALARAEQVVLRPESLDAFGAAVSAMSGVTAYQALQLVAPIHPGQDVLILGASGGVGSYAVQIARHMGARVSAVCSRAKADYVLALGAHRVFDYTNFGVLTNSLRYPLVIDIGSNRPISELRQFLGERGTLILVGGEQGNPWMVGLRRPLAAWCLNPFLSGHRLVPLVSTVRQEDLGALSGLIETGAILPSLDRTFGLEKVAEAVEYMAQGHARGKVAIAIKASDGAVL